MSLFDWLLVVHLVGDFLLQSDRMAGNKTRNRQWLLRHVGLYILIVSPVLVLYALLHHVPAWTVASAVLFLFGTHLALDRREPVAWWMQRVGMAPDHPWLPIVIDQVFHLLTLAIVAQALFLVQP